MKYTYLLFLILTFFTTTTKAQFQSTSYSVTKGDLETNYYAADSTANALVIYEHGNSYLDKNTFKLITEIKRKVKILNKQGVDNATIEISLYKGKRNKEKVKKIVATTYNVSNGEVTKDVLNENQIFTEEYDNKYDVKKFTLPNIQKGSVITYSYQIESPYIYKYYGWKFQEDIPKLYSEYHTSIPAIYDYNIKLVGTLELDENTSDLKRHCLEVGNGGAADCTITKYSMKDIPAFIEEDYLTSKKNYISRIEYELNTVNKFDGSVDKITKTWKDADKELKMLPSIGKQLNKKTNLNSLLTNLKLDVNNDPLSKPKEIYKFIQDRFAWNKKYRIFKEVSVKDLEQSRTGNVTEINILLHNALKENGFDVKPVLLSTRKNGLPTKLFPVISEFNYLIVLLKIDNQSYFLDATDKYLSFGQLPFKCLNEYGRVLDFKNGSEWIDIKENETSFVQYQVKLNISDTYNIQGIVNTRYTGYKALNKKKNYYPNPDSYLEEITENQINIEVIDHEVLSSGKTDKEFKESFKITFSEDNNVEDKIYFNPFIYKFFAENPFKLQQRTYPIDFGYKDSFTYYFELDLADKYEVVELPKGINLKLPNNSGDLIFSSTMVKNKINLFLKINFKRSQYNSPYYEYLKKFMSNLIDVQNNSLIVLKKK